VHDDIGSEGSGGKMSFWNNPDLRNPVMTHSPLTSVPSYARTSIVPARAAMSSFVIQRMPMDGGVAHFLSVLDDLASLVLWYVVWFRPT